MKVAIVLPIRSGVSGGFIKHLNEVVPRWRKMGGLDKISIVAPAGLTDGFGSLDVDVRQVMPDDYRTGFSQMGGIAKNGEYDIVLNTTARPVRLDGIPLVTMVQNIEPIQRPSYPMPLLWRLRLWALRHEHAIACRKTTRVLAVSQYVKDEVCRRFHVPDTRTDVVYHGFDSSEVAAQTQRPELNCPADDFIFSAGSIVPYRGYEDIIRALAHIRAQGGKAPYTVLAGSGTGPSKTYERSLRQLASSLNVSDVIVWAGQLERAEMSWCFQKARMYIQTSRAEACPNIVLEAMGHGCISISSTQPPMPEFFQDVASYYPPGDSVSLASAIMATLSANATACEIIKSRARNRAGLFTWEKTAELTLESLNRAMDDFKKVKGTRREAGQR